MTIAVAYVTTLVSTAEATTYNLGNVVIPNAGTVAIIVSLVTSARATIASATLGGVSMTNLDNAGGGGFETISSFKLDGVAAGTLNLTVVMSGDIGATQPNVTVHVWNVTGNASTPFAHGASTGSTSLAINTAASGVAVFAVQGSANPASFSAATTRYGPTNTGFIWNMAGDLATSSQTPHTETAGSSNFSFMGISWQAGATNNVFTLGVGAFTFTGQSNDTSSHRYAFAIAAGAFAVTGRATTLPFPYHMFLGTASYHVIGGIMGFLTGRKTFKHTPASTSRLLPTLEQVRVNDPVLDEAREI